MLHHKDALKDFRTVCKKGECAGSVDVGEGRVG